MTGLRRWGLLFVSILTAVLIFSSLPDASAEGSLAGLVGELKAKAKEDTSSDVKDAVKVTRRSDRDCVRFTFEPNEPAKSEAVWLRSTEYREECTYDGRGGRHCHEVPGWTYRERVTVELKNRQKLFPFEKESVIVCLDGRWLSIHDGGLAHEYTSQRNGGDYVLTAGKRIIMDPDKHGIEAQAPVARGDGLALSFTDKWASYYAGEQVVIRFKVKREVKNWFDPTLAEREWTVSAADLYTAQLTSAELSERLEAGKKYYVEWSFKRISRISKPTEMKRGDGPVGVYKPTLLFVGR